MIMQGYVDEVADLFKNALARIDGITTDEIKSVRVILANNEPPEVRSLEICLDYCIEKKSWHILSLCLKIIEAHRGG